MIGDIEILCDAESAQSINVPRIEISHFIWVAKRFDITIELRGRVTNKQDEGMMTNVYVYSYAKEKFVLLLKDYPAAYPKNKNELMDTLGKVFKIVGKIRDDPFKAIK